MSKLDELKGLIDYTYLPEHVAIIMDGNGRWAKERGMMRIFGHENGVKAVRETTEAAAEIGIKYLTLYAFFDGELGAPSGGGGCVDGAIGENNS
jgi:undecaprenyl diphosphate synthase